MSCLPNQSTQGKTSRHGPRATLESFRRLFADGLKVLAWFLRLGETQFALYSLRHDYPALKHNNEYSRSHALTQVISISFLAPLVSFSFRHHKMSRLGQAVKEMLSHYGSLTNSAFSLRAARYKAISHRSYSISDTDRASTSRSNSNRHRHQPMNGGLR